MKHQEVLSDVIDDVAIGALINNRKTGKLAVIVDFDEFTGMPLIAATCEEVDNCDDWIVTAMGSDNFDDENGMYARKVKRKKGKS